MFTHGNDVRLAQRSNRGLHLHHIHLPLSILSSIALVRVVEQLSRQPCGNEVKNLPQQ
jgi:hypothetical protein